MRRRRLAMLVVGAPIAVAAALLMFAPSVYAELLPLSHRVANGGYATDTELPPNTIEQLLEWTGSPGVARDVEIDWDDGTFEVLTGVVSPHVIRHTYAAPGGYRVSVRVLGEPFGLKFFDVAVLDVPAGAEAKIVSPLVGGSNRFGTSVAYDGVRAAIGAGPEPSQTTRYGRVYTYLRDGSRWRFEQTLTAPTQVQGAEFGSSVALDGARMAVGASSDRDAAGNTVGAVYIFELGSSGWASVQKIQPDVLLAGDSFGATLALEGTRLVIGASGDDGAGTSRGAVYLYELATDGTWTMAAQLTSPIARDTELFGTALDLRGDLIVVGAPEFSADGTVNGVIHAYLWGTTVPTSPLASLAPYLQNEGTGARFGASVTIGDNGLIAVGAPNRVATPGQTHAGTVTVVQLIGSDLTVLDTLNPPDGVTGFGMAVDVDGERIAGHAWSRNAFGTLVGRDVLVFAPDAGLAKWVQIAHFIPTPGNSWGIGGPTNRRVAIVGDRIISAEDFDEDARYSGWETGAAYVWTIAPSVPPPAQLLVAESILVDDQPELIAAPPPVQLVVTESIAVGDQPQVAYGAPQVARLFVSESILVDHGSETSLDVRPPPVDLRVVESIAVDDLPDLSPGAASLPPVEVGVIEVVRVIDTPGISVGAAPLPPVDVAVVETVLVIDLPGIEIGAAPLPPVDVAVVETILVIDLPGIEIGAAPLSPVDVAVFEVVIAVDQVDISASGGGSDDGDGIGAAIDGFVDGTSFSSEADVFSDRFTDEHLGGTTPGRIVDRGDQEVAVEDSSDPLRGVLVSVGEGADDVTMRFCDAQFLTTLSPGTSADLTCGSLTTTVRTGTVTVTLGDGTIVAIPAGATVLVTDRDGGGWTVEVLTGSGVVVTSGDETVTLDEGNTWPENHPPAADANGPYLVAAGSSVALDGSGSADPDGDALTYLWSSPGANLDDPAGVSANFTADVAGVYLVMLVVCDPSAACDATETTVAVYDPNGGFVTGGGWIESPPGACGGAAPEGVCDLDPAGRATFAFVSRYKKGASVPEGETEFLFQAGDLRFRSSSYDWLVVAGRDRAQFKGVGSMNGGGSYEFMLTAYDAGDGGVDGFRIKIWNATGVVYDNRVDADNAPQQANTQPIAGGNIVIHTKN